jgi:hypothetical protein
MQKRRMWLSKHLLLESSIAGDQYSYSPRDEDGIGKIMATPIETGTVLASSSFAFGTLRPISKDQFRTPRRSYEPCSVVPELRVVFLFVFVGVGRLAECSTRNFQLLSISIPACNYHGGHIQEGSSIHTETTNCLSYIIDVLIMVSRLKSCKPSFMLANKQHVLLLKHYRPSTEQHQLRTTLAAAKHWVIRHEQLVAQGRAMSTRLHYGERSLCLQAEEEAIKDRDQKDIWNALFAASRQTTEFTVCIGSPQSYPTALMNMSLVLPP